MQADGEGRERTVNEMTEITLNDLASSETLNYLHTFYGALREHERLAHSLSKEQKPLLRDIRVV